MQQRWQGVVQQGEHQLSGNQRNHQTSTKHVVTTKAVMTKAAWPMDGWARLYYTVFMWLPWWQQRCPCSNVYMVWPITALMLDCEGMTPQCLHAGC